MSASTDIDGRDGGYSALVNGSALIEQPAREWLEVSGEDRLRFVNGLVTCDVRSLKPGDGTYGFFTSSQGRVLADVVVSSTDELLLLDLPAGTASLIADHMLRYKVADRVEVEKSGESAQIVVAGAESPALLAELLGQSIPQQAWSWRKAGDLDLHSEERIGVAATRVRGAENDIAGLVSRLEDAGAVHAGPDVVTTVRVERGMPWCGVDFSEDNFPQETGLEEKSVSYEKGCYLGQEIVARIHYRGHVNRRVCGLVSAGPAIETGSELFLQGERVGEVTSAVASVQLGSSIALAMIHIKATESVTLSDGTRLSLVDLPFV